MSLEEMTETVRRLFTEIDGHNAGYLRAVASDDFVCRFPGAPGPLDQAGLIQIFDEFVAALPDVRHNIDDILAEGDRVVVRLTITGTHRGPLMGIPASNAAIRISAINQFRFADKRIAQQWVEADMLSMLHQVGAIPAATPA
jgi:steroid delta-isomerase-like uncharacterized protein